MGDQGGRCRLPQSTIFNKEREGVEDLPRHQGLTSSVGQLDVQGRLGKVTQLPYSSIRVCHVDEVKEVGGALHRPHWPLALHTSGR